MPRTYKKLCRLCSAEFTARAWDTKYCGSDCRTEAFKTGFAEYACGTAACAHCNSKFDRKHLRHAYCTPACKEAAQKARGGVPTEQQYRRLSGDWVKYLRRLCTKATRSALTPEILYAVLERQKFNCALTGVPLTCTLSKGVRTWTNASIDRIIPGAAYTEDNVRLTCARINILRGNMSDSEFLHWCTLVVQHSEKPNATQPPQI